MNKKKKKKRSSVGPIYKLLFGIIHSLQREKSGI